MEKRNRYSPELKERAVQMVFTQGSEYGSQWETINSIASKMGCSPETELSPYFHHILHHILMLMRPDHKHTTNTNSLSLLHGFFPDEFEFASFFPLRKIISHA
jgi:hypothetical protein